MSEQKKQRLHIKRINRVALVDIGDNPEAHVVIHKRAEQDQPGLVQRMAQSIGRRFRKTDEPMTFNEVRGQARAQQEAWRFVDDLMASFRTIMESDEANKAAKIAESVEQFAATVKEAAPQWMGASGDAEKQDNSEGDMAEATKQVIEGAVEKAQPAVETTTEVQANVDKPADPKVDETLEKRIEAAEKRAQNAEALVAKMALERREADIEKRIEREFGHLPVKAGDFAKIMRKIEDGEKLTDEERKEHDRVLRAANEAVRVGKLFEEIGTGGDEGSAAAQIDALVKEAQKADPKLSYEQAYSQVAKAKPGLRQQAEADEARVRKERAGR